jgi:DNA modification methylase
MSVEWKNKLYYGNNLDVLRSGEIPSGSVDLVYLDPPFNSKRAYNVFLTDPGGEESSAQIHAFDDTWKWTPETDRAYTDMLRGAAPEGVARALEAMFGLLGKVELMAYLVMMAPRLVILREALKPTGSLYLHCDPTASHYLKLLLDAVFGPKRFRNEITWRRTGAHGKAKRWGPIHDTILFYTRSDEYTWNHPRRPYMKGHVERYFVQDDKGWRTDYYGNVLTGSGLRGGESGQPWRGFDPSAKGRHWAIPGGLIDDLDEDVSNLSQHEKLDRLYELGQIKIVPGEAWPIYERYLQPEDGQAVGDIWAYQPYTEGTLFGSGEAIDADVRWLSSADRTERTGYETQKPVGLLARIIRASSNEGDLVLDPFCGCGTTVVAAQALGRRWIGIDISYLAIDLTVKQRLQPVADQATFEVRGIPSDLEGARALLARDPFEFERWAVTQLNGQPNEKQVADQGIDGVVKFLIPGQRRPGRALVSVKGGRRIAPTVVRDLRGTLEREGAEMGILVLLEAPTRGITQEVNRSGNYTYPANGRGRSYPRVQVITVAQILEGKRPDLPPVFQAYSARLAGGLPSDQLSLGP